MTTLIIIGVLVLLVLWFFSVQRSLVSHDEMCKNSLSQIGVQQSSRWDALTAIAELVKSYNEHEYNTLRDIIAMRKSVNGGSATADVEGQEKALQSAIAQINAVAMDSVNTYENQVRMSRMVYNDSVTAYNRIIRQVPSNIVASLLHFGTREYLEVPQEKTAMPSMKI